MGERIYALTTHVIESSLEYPQATALILELEKLNVITLISKTDSLEEFILGRRELYGYDIERYPYYFNEENILKYPVNPLVITDSTTSFIYANLKQNHPTHENLKGCITMDDYLNYIVTSKLRSFHGEGLTINSFRKLFPGLMDFGVDKKHVTVISYRLNNELIFLHNKKYLQATKSDIILNIPGINKHDNIDTESWFDYQICDAILSPVVRTMSKEQMQISVIQWKVGGDLRPVTKELQNLMVQLYRANHELFLNYERRIAVQMIVDDIREVQQSIRLLRHCKFNSAYDIADYIAQLNKRINTNSYHEEEGKNMKVLLPVANMTEYKNILKMAESFGMHMKSSPMGTNTYHICEMEQGMLAVVKCEAGSLGSASSTLTLADAVRTLDIDTIIFSGVAFGNYLKRDESQTMGDILVSRQIWNYESGKVLGDTTFIARGDKITATPWLLDRFQSSALSWEKSKIHFGLVVSGEKLVNSEDFIKNLMDSEPELIGGEMEGAGLIAVAERYKKDWILVKAISDWGVDKKDEGQEQASNLAFEYVFRTIKECF